MSWLEIGRKLIGIWDTLLWWSAFFLRFFLMWTIFLSLYWTCYNIVSVFVCVCVGSFGQEACGILSPWPGTEPAPSALEGEVVTTGPPGKFLGDLIEHIYLVHSLPLGWGLLLPPLKSLWERGKPPNKYLMPPPDICAFLLFCPGSLPQFCWQTQTGMPFLCH